MRPPRADPAFTEWLRRASAKSPAIRRCIDNLGRLLGLVLIVHLIKEFGVHRTLNLVSVQRVIMDTGPEEALAVLLPHLTPEQQRELKYRLSRIAPETTP